MKRSSLTSTSMNNLGHSGSTLELHSSHNQHGSVSPATSAKDKSNNSLNPKTATESLVKCVNQLSLSNSNLNGAASHEEKTSDTARLLKSSNSAKNKSNNTLNADEPHQDDANKGQSEFKLVSAYGDWCAFE
jgi:hypothetical protein